MKQNLEAERLFEPVAATPVIGEYTCCLDVTLAGKNGQAEIALLTGSL
jgi:hypothetical protein